MWLPVSRASFLGKAPGWPHAAYGSGVTSVSLLVCFAGMSDGTVGHPWSHRQDSALTGADG